MDDQAFWACQPSVENDDGYLGQTLITDSYSMTRIPAAIQGLALNLSSVFTTGSPQQALSTALIELIDVCCHIVLSLQLSNALSPACNGWKRAGKKPREFRHPNSKEFADNPFLISYNFYLLPKAG